MTISFMAGRRIQGLDSEKTYLSASNTYNSTATGSTASVALGGGAGSGHTKVGFEVFTGHAFVGKYLSTIKIKLDVYGTVSGTGYMSVYDSSGTLKSSSSTYNLSTLPAYPSPIYFTFTFSTPQLIANGDRIVLEGGTFNTSNQIDFYGTLTSTDSYTNIVYYNGGTWTSQTDRDCHYIDAITYDSINSLNVQSGSRFEATDTRKIYYFDSGYTVHTFTTTGSDTFQITSGSGDIEYLVVAGGGGGGKYEGGGGGAGGVLTGTVSKSTGSYTVTVGSGGAAGNGVDYNGSNGNDSVFDNLTAIGGGGGGGSGGGSNNGKTGGSGGGGGGAGSGGAGTAGQGNAGGAGGGIGGNYPSGGGGGAGQAGQAGSGSTSGDGGDGIQSSISGTPTYYGGGGGGGIFASSYVSSGGLGGGGDGQCNAVDGQANTGGGGGGESNNSCALTTGGAGGSGIVIVRYKNSTGIVATGGTKTIIGKGFSEES